MIAPHPALLVRAGLDDAALRRAKARGDLVRVAPGRYVRSEHWEGFDENARHAMRAIAVVSRMASPAVLSHASAGAAWGFPRLGPLPAVIHLTDPRLERTTHGRSTVKHVGSLAAHDIARRYDVLLTDPARTAVDLARTSGLRQAVVALDHGLREHLFTRETLESRHREAAGRRGACRAGRAIRLADARAESAGESLSRVVIHEARLHPPMLQQSFHGEKGRPARVDFWWPEVGIIGEFDGLTKYLHAERWSGSSAAEVVTREKLREDWLRSIPEVRGFVRWTWDDAVRPGTLASKLRAAGVPLQDATFRARRDV
jgi:hypothetical protein